MTDCGEKEIIEILAEFFINEFAHDPAGVADWLEEDGIDPDQFVADVRSLSAPSLQTEGDRNG